MHKYFLYIRKSTYEDDRQVLSLEARETELLELAEKEKLIVVDIFRESQTAKKQKILNHKIEISEKLKDFGKTANHWLEPAKKFILDSKQAEIIALQKNLFEKKDFLKKIGSNRILRERELVFEPRGTWQILLKSGLSARRAHAEPRRGEATNAEHTMWLPQLNAIRTCLMGGLS